MRANIIKKFEEMNWAWPEQDPGAVEELQQRIEETARNQDLIIYSDFVRGVTFSIPTVNDGEPFEIDTGEWSDFDRSLVGDFLGFLSYQSYLHSGIFISAIVVTKHDGQPGQGFTELMLETGMQPNTRDEAAVTCWVAEVQKVHDEYKE